MEVLKWISNIILFIPRVLFHVCIGKIELSSKNGSFVYETIKKRGKIFSIYKEWNHRFLPSTYMCISTVNNTLIFTWSKEKTAHAGNSPTYALVTAYVMRWKLKGFTEFLNNESELIVDTIPVYLLQEYSKDKLGEISMDQKWTPLCDESIYKDIEDDIILMKAGEINKVSAILYGQPGNGKTSLVRYLAIKYKLPIYVAVFERDLTNTGLIKMFTHAEGPCIVLMEDFDNCFKGRECTIPDAQCSLDSLLNVFDGVYHTHKQIAYFMTANHINDIDPALKDRPSRFKYVRNINNPKANIRKKLLAERYGEKYNDEKIANMVDSTKDFNLDQVLGYSPNNKMPDLEFISK